MYYDLEKENKIKPTMVGVGYDTGGKWKPTQVVNGKWSATREYRTWANMFRRCYDENFHILQPTYAECSVHEDWHDFQVFAEWLTSHQYYCNGYELDKDILSSGSKQYSPQICTLIPKEINMLFTDCRAVRGDLPIGVSWHKKAGKYMAQLKADGKSVYLGLHTTIEKAHAAYVIAKEAHVKVVANRWRGRIEDRVYYALMNWTVN